MTRFIQNQRRATAQVHLYSPLWAYSGVLYTPNHRARIYREESFTEFVMQGSHGTGPSQTIGENCQRINLSIIRSKIPSETGHTVQAPCLSSNSTDQLVFREASPEGAVDTSNRHAGEEFRRVSIVMKHVD